MHALVVDDSRAMRSLLTRILTKAGYEVDSAGNGAEALEALKELRPDVMLVDWHMPVMDGLELIRRVCAANDPARPKLLMITSEVELDNIRQALEAGADEYLMKPFEPASLLDKLTGLGLAA